MNAPLNSIAKLRMTEEGQAVILPAGMVLPGREVIVRQEPGQVILETSPACLSNDEKARIWQAMTPEERVASAQAFFAEMRRYTELYGEFMPEGREQPPMPEDDRTYFD